MKLHPRFKYTIIIGLLFIIIIIVFNNYRTIHRFIDTVKGGFYSIKNDIFPKSYTGMPGKNKYITTFKQLPGNMVHAGTILLYKVEKNTTIDQIAAHIVDYTRYLHIRSLTRDISIINNLHDKNVQSGTILAIPKQLSTYTIDYKNNHSSKLVYTNGLYFSGYSMGNGKILNNLRKFKKHKINTIVFDVKDITGIVNYKSSVLYTNTYNLHKHRSIDNIKHFIRILQENKFYTIARIAVFRDHLLVKNAPGLAIQSRSRRGVWNRGDKELWCDPTNKKVQDYNIGLAIELAKSGVDEIQFDYIRFPTVGDLSDAQYKYDFNKMKKEQAIALFLKRAHESLKPYNTKLSIDIFGVVAWGKNIDIKRTGQRIELLAKHCDVISPMLYPSHFNDDFDGYARPGDEPYYFIYTGSKKVAERANKQAAVRPWLQAFKWRVSNYNKMYILKQIKASIDSGAHGYLFWNASNNYAEVFDAMQHVKKIN